MAGMYIVLGAALLIACSSATAPGDEDERCQQGSFAHSYEEGVKPLMDSQNYEQLLGVSGAVWDETDFDDNNSDFFLYQTHWQHSVGGICRWSIQSCGSSQGRQENWAFTQYISKDVPSGTNYNVEVCVNVTHRISNCRTRYGCNPEFEVYKYITSGPQSRSNVRNRDNYERILYRRVEQAATLTDQRCFTLRNQDEGFYIGLRDPNSCILVSSVFAYRHECAARQVGLVDFPATASPIGGPRSLSAQCVANAELVSSLRVQCRSDGIWVGTPQCRCKAGYKQERDRQGDLLCSACPAGTYRSSSDPQSTCLPCPDNTARNQIAAAQCQCLTNYFRNTEGLSDNCPAGQVLEKPGDGCTKPPGQPRGLSVIRVTQDSIGIQWGAPSFAGRPDIYYTVEYSDPNTAGRYIVASADNCLRSLRYVITGLRPATGYHIRVVAHNGVSDQDQGGMLSRMAVITATTSNAPPSSPINLQVTSNTDAAVWDAPERPNGVIRNYMVMIYRSSSPTRSAHINRQTNGRLHYVIDKDSDIPSGTGDICVKVRAVNDAGTGQWSEESCTPGPGTTCDCPECTPPTPCPQCPSPVCPSLPPCPECPTCVECPSQEPSISPPTTATQPPSNRPSLPPVIVRIPGDVTTVRMINCKELSWDRPADDGGQITEYRVRVSSGGWYDAESSQKRVFSTTEARLLLDWLPSQGEVQAIVKAKNSAGFSVGWSPAVSLPACASSGSTTTSTPPQTTTPTTNPPPIRTPGTVTNVREINCNTLEWNPPADDGGEITEYRIRVFSGATYFEASEKHVFSATTTRLVMDWLPNATPITAIIKAKNSAGFSASWSQAVTLTEGASSCSALG